MTELLERAVAKTGTLSESEQDALGRLLLDEIESERAWEERFAKRSDKLGKLADVAREEHGAGKSEPLDPESL